MITGGGETASRDTLTLVFWAASAGVESPARIAAPLRGKHVVAAVEATPERNRLRENPLESGTVRPFPDCKLSIVVVDATRWSAFRHVRWSRAAYVEDARHAGFRRGQGRELGVRLGLVPVRYRVEVVGAVIGVAVLDGYAD
jgi:hypothetical protein